MSTFVDCLFYSEIKLTVDTTKLKSAVPQPADCPLTLTLHIRNVFKWITNVEAERSATILDDLIN